jgi:hypothetical protein
MWAEMTGTRITREEISILRSMDESFRSALAREHREQRERDKQRG